jgi:hypothetical protein
MWKTEIICGLASLREKFMGQLRVANVSRKGAKARRRFPGLASWRWISHADCLPSVDFPKEGGQARRRRDADRFSDVPLSQFLLFRHHSINPLSPSFATRHHPPNQSESK